MVTWFNAYTNHSLNIHANHRYQITLNVRLRCWNPNNGSKECELWIIPAYTLRSNKLILYGRIQDSCMLVLTNIIPEILLTLPTKSKTRLIAGRGWWLEAHLSSAPCQASCLPVRRDDCVWHLSSRWGLEDVCSHIPFPMCPLKCWLTRITFITGWF